MERRSCIKVCIFAQDFNASIQVVTYMFLQQGWQRGCLAEEGTSELKAETSGSSSTIPSRPLINASTTLPLNRTCTSMRVLDDNLSGD